MDNSHFSLARALARLADPAREAEVELEAARDLAKSQGTTARGMLIPGTAFSRAQTTGTTGAGGALVGQQPDGYAGALRDALVMGRAGATVLTGVRGDASIPSITSGVAASWLDEGITGAADAADSTPTMSRGVVTPKTCAAAIPVSRRLLLQGQPDVAAIVAADLMAGLASEIDAAAIGAGAAGAPDGLRQALAGDKVTWAGATPTASELLGLEQSALEGGARDDGLAFIAAPAMMSSLKSAAINSGTGSPMIGGENRPAAAGQIMGRPAIITNAMPANEIVCGGFADLVIVMFGSGIDLRLDVGSGAASETRTLRAFADVGILTRRTAPFGYGAQA